MKNYLEEELEIVKSLIELQSNKHFKIAFTNGLFRKEVDKAVKALSTAVDGGEIALKRLQSISLLQNWIEESIGSLDNLKSDLKYYNQKVSNDNR